MAQPIHEAASRGYQIAGDSYEKGRPEYPKDAIQFLLQEIGITSGKTVVDLGAGTGKFTKLIVDSGADIIAIEPVEGMRKTFSEVLPQVLIKQGTAEDIPLADHSVDGLVVAQAFHWFDGEKALAEIFRILKPGSKLGLIWNARDESLDWVSKLTDIIDPHENGAPRYRTGAWRKAFEVTKMFSPLITKHFGYVQKGAPQIIVDRVASISFISALDSVTKARVLEEVRELLEAHPQTKGLKEIELPYRTDVFMCSRK
jgi:ubiquinone/menaquinone biosynthesis C-methylase UbiE